MPGLGYRIVKEADGHFLQLEGQWHLTLDGLTDVDESLSDCTCQCIESEQLLGQHSVQGVLILDRMLLCRVLSVEVRWNPA